MADEYPKRESFHSHRVVRLMAKTAAASTIGADACWLVTLVAHQEDTCRYKKPISYSNEQLMLLAGIQTKRRFWRIRQAAIEGGWLHYEECGTRKPGVYWTLIPDRFADLPDTGATDGLGVKTAPNQDGLGAEMAPNVTPNPAPNVAPNPAPPSTLDLNPDPDPKEKRASPPRKSKEQQLADTKAEVVFPQELDTQAVRDAVYQWLEYKTFDKKSPYKSAQGVNLLLKRFVKHGAAAFCDRVSYSIENNYHGVFEPERKSSGANQPVRGSRNGVEYSDHERAF
jgi:hypothetical protein